MQSGKNEILLIKNLLKPVKTVDRPAIKTDNEFESIKLRKTETLDDKIQEKSLSSHSENGNEFFNDQLRKTKSPNEKDNDKIDAVSKKKDIKRLRKSSGILSPGQKKIEAFFLKKTKVGGTGLSRESINTKQTIQGADIGSLVGVLNSGASQQPSGGSKSLPVERGGG